MTEPTEDTRPPEDRKTCRSCGQDKLGSDFNRHSRSSDGLNSECRECARLRNRDYRRRHPGLRGGWSDEQRASYTAQWRRENAEKEAAHGVLRRAVRSGRMARQTECSACGQGGRIEAHHDDYSKPLDVLWLCVTCHRDRHATLRAKGNAA